MTDASPLIEALENRFMRAWIAGDAKELKALTARDFILIVGSKPAMFLDRRSWIEAAGRNWACTRYRFGDIQVRRLGSFALFSTQLEMTASLDGAGWPERMWLTDLWRKRRIGGWKLVHRALSRVEDSPQIPRAIRALQLWR